MFVKRKGCANEKGMALVSVMIIITLVALMAGTLLQLSYLAYSRKIVEKRNTETFYAAESVVDTVKAVVQNSVAQAIAKAKDGDDAFLKEAYAVLLNIDTTTTTIPDNASTTNVSALESYLRTKIFYESDGVTLRDDEYYYNGYETTTFKDALTSIADGGNGGEFKINGPITIEESCVRISNVHVLFVNDEGYTSEITTDIVINAPVYASDITVPVGTYSMFAGNGAAMENTNGTYLWQENNHKAQMSGIRYFHQEGNVYIGESKTGTISFEIGTSDSTNNSGALYASFGGTNVVINGDVYVYNGNTLIFTGGDGKTNANIQVNGYIYLKDGATLLLPANANLVCKGIKVINADNSISDYTGAGISETSLSQFYPFTQAYAQSKAGDTYTTHFLNNDADFAQVLAKINVGQDVMESELDPRAHDIMASSTNCAVYILKAENDTTTGWVNRSDDQYYLLQKAGGVWKCDEAGVYKSQITCNESDPKLDPEEKITFNGVKYDAEFAEIVNIPLLVKFTENHTINKGWPNFDLTDASTYTEFKWNEMSTYFPAIYDSIKSNFRLDEMASGDVDFASRIFRRGTTAYSDSLATNINTSSYSFNVKSFGSSYDTFSLHSVKMGYVPDDLNPAQKSVMLWVSGKAMTVRTTGEYSGLFMSADNVKFGGSSGGVTRGISLVEMAEKTDANPGITNENNPVRTFLTDYAAGLMYSDPNGIGMMVNNVKYYEFMLMDNVFNTGIEIFWNRSSDPDSNSNKTASSQNAVTDFVGVDNWQKQ